MATLSLPMRLKASIPSRGKKIMPLYQSERVIRRINLALPCSHLNRLAQVRPALASHRPPSVGGSLTMQGFFKVGSPHKIVGLGPDLPAQKSEEPKKYSSGFTRLLTHTTKSKRGFVETLIETNNRSWGLQHFMLPPPLLGHPPIVR